MNKKDYLKELLNSKKNKCTDLNILNEIEKLEFLINKDEFFFDIDIDTAVGVLEFIGVPEDKIKDVYFDLISYDNFKKNEKIEYYSNKI